MTTAYEEPLLMSRRSETVCREPLRDSSRSIAVVVRNMYVYCVCSLLAVLRDHQMSGGPLLRGVYYDDAGSYSDNV